MSVFYCVCDATPYPSVCDCTGTSYAGLEGNQSAGSCGDYTSGTPESRSFSNSNTCYAYVSSQTVRDTDFAFDGNYYKLFSGGETIYASTLQSMWNFFLNTIVPHFKSLTYSYNTPSDLSIGNIVSHNHIERLRNNIVSVHSNGNEYKLIYGQGKIQDKNGNELIANYSSDISSNYFASGQIISHLDINRMHTWLRATYANCECVQNNFKKCCYCDIVCDCNY